MKPVLYFIHKDYIFEFSGVSIFQNVGKSEAIVTGVSHDVFC